MNNLKKKAMLSILLTAFLPLLGIAAYFLPNIKE